MYNITHYYKSKALPQRQRKITEPCKIYILLERLHPTVCYLKAAQTKLVLQVEIHFNLRFVISVDNQSWTMEHFTKTQHWNIHCHSATSSELGMLKQALYSVHSYIHAPAHFSQSDQYFNYLGLWKFRNIYSTNCNIAMLVTQTTHKNFTDQDCSYTLGINQ